VIDKLLRGAYLEMLDAYVGDVGDVGVKDHWLSRLGTIESEPSAIDVLIQANDALLEHFIGFHEGKQRFFCKVCRYRDPLWEGTKLHADECVIYKMHAALDKVRAAGSRHLEQAS